MATETIGPSRGAALIADVLEADVLAAARRAKDASYVLRSLTRATKDRALHAIATALEEGTPDIVAANRLDVAAATAAATSPAIIDRLNLDDARIAAIAAAVRDVADLADPVGEVVRGYTLPNGLQIRQVRVPLGVIAMVYEARPNVTVDAAVLALKSGNAALLRGSGSAYRTNVALVDVIGMALATVGLPRDAVTMVPGTDHKALTYLMSARGLIDVLIPRGGADLIRTVVENSRVPVIETGVGNCHVYVDAAADLDKALRVLLNAKTQRVSVCNAAETVLVHRDVAAEFLPVALRALADAGVTVHGDVAVRDYAAEAGIDALEATDEDWAAEYYSLDIAARVVNTIDDAIVHIRAWSSGHTEAIVTESLSAAQVFVAAVDSAAVMVNASTRFTDGGEFGFGAEIGISTQKLHARGPMGLTELTTTTFVVTGDGHIRS